LHYEVWEDKNEISGFKKSGGKTDFNANFFPYFCNIYPQHFEEKVGFDRIRAMLHNKCLSPMGSEWVDAMHFQDDFETISRQLGEVNEFCRIIREVENFPSSHFYDLRSALQKIKIEGRFLEAEELFDLKRSLESVRAIVQFFKKQEEDIFPLAEKENRKSAGVPLHL
jgi:DNA mismatch repair protein MutS2